MRGECSKGWGGDAEAGGNVTCTVCECENDVLECSWLGEGGRK